ncbi:MAG: ABC transporter substrate-binding protein [Kofleriaceae bacterium]|nr:ABC transporter substrate-binding protein [Kofleriaceae bacterium]
MSRFRLVDALGRELSFVSPPRRVVSLVPSDTHTVEAIGAAAALVGRTDYCVGAIAARLPAVGGTKNVSVEAVLACAPDLVLANQEENSRTVLEQLAQHTKVLVSLPRRFDDGLAHVAQLARIFGTAGDVNVKALLSRGMAVGKSRNDAALANGPAVFFPIWREPWMTCNGDTFGSDMLALAGARNVFADRLRLYPLAADLGKAPAQDATGRDVRYPRVTLVEVARRAPSVILLPNEPYAFAAAETAELAAALPGVPQLVVDGKDLFWAGAWSIDAVARLRAQLLQIVA